MLSEGAAAPAFSLSGIHGPTDEGATYEIREFSLSSLLEDGPVLLAFYPGDFSPVCTEQLCALGDIEVDAGSGSTPLYGISRDSLFSHESFAYEHDLTLPLLSDVEGETCRAYDAIHEDPVEDRGVEAGLPKRTLYVVDADGTISYAWQSEDPQVSPDLDPAIEPLSTD